MPRNATARNTAAVFTLALLFACSAEERTAQPGFAPARVDAQNASGRPYSEPREACANHDPMRQALFGELHLHTVHSMDANMWDVRGTPDDAYRFARGLRLGLAPYDAEGAPMRHAQLERPLDFAAVTDHALFLGAVSLCRTPGSPVYASERCQIYRGELPPPGDGLGIFGRLAGLVPSPEESGVDSNDPAALAALITTGRSKELCGENDARCLAQMDTVWREIQQATERHYDRSSACSFSSFHGYEYTATPGLAKVHRNVIFRNGTVPARPVSFIDVPEAVELWRRLKRECLDAGNGCDVLAIPHNSNLSNGRMFGISAEYRALPRGEQAARARLRRNLEPLVELTQIKGDSECRNGMFGISGAADEFCGYEKIRVMTHGEPPEDCGEGMSFGALGGQGCQARTDFVRYALIEGLREAGRIGVNPYQMGFIGSSDAHNANPGDTNEQSFEGWRGALDDTPAKRLTDGDSAAIANWAGNPGGLVGAWAEENSRDSIFDAMKRRETFATSGTRLTARFFGGWNYDESLCEDAELVKRGYAEGVPMGGELPSVPQNSAAGATAAPTFVVSALRDPGTDSQPGGLLQRAQIVKGWVGADGQFHQRVVDVAGGANSADVDLQSCAPRGPGHGALCGVWRDPDFNPQQRAVYYARVLENPGCRWSTWHCNALPQAERPAACNNAKLPKTIQERLWTSPIWFNPPAS